VGPEPVQGLETRRPDGQRQEFHFVDSGAYWESVEQIPEPHAFTACLHLSDGRHETVFQEHSHERTHHHGGAGAAHRDYNIRSAYIHVMADAVVSVLAITGLVLARAFGWVWMDPLAGIVGALVIANWSYGLVRDTGRILLDMDPDRDLGLKVREVIEATGDQIADLHLWRLGPGHLGVVLSVVTGERRDGAFYHARLKAFKNLSHVTVEVINAAA
jgi:cation diffusion facilitator family transporter